MQNSSRGDPQILQPAVSSEPPVTFSACRNCPRSAIQAQEEVLDPCCEPYGQPSPCLSSLDQRKGTVEMDEQQLLTKSFAGCFLFPVEWRSQSSLTSVWTSLARCKPLSLVNLVRPLHWFWSHLRGIHIQLKPLKLITVMDVWLD